MDIVIDNVVKAANKEVSASSVKEKLHRAVQVEPASKQPSQGWVCFAPSVKLSDYGQTVLML